MLFYLDNFLSADPRAAQRQAAQRAMRQARCGRSFRRPPQQQQAKKNVRGLNENYGRELMELHTLGVDGGYTQKDVTEVARCFTGWTIEKPRETSGIQIRRSLTRSGCRSSYSAKKIHAGGMKDGEEVIDLLVHHPSTAKFISTKLARRFVSDNPPPALVARMAQTFQSSDGDIRAVLKTMIYSPEFWSRDAYRAKDQDPVRAGGFHGARAGHRRRYTDAPGAMDRPHRRAPLSMSASHRLLRQSRRLGQYRRAAQSAELFAGAGREQGSRLAQRYALAAGHGLIGGRQGRAGSRRPAFPRRPDRRRTTVATLEKQLDNPQIVQAKLDDPVKRVDLGVVAGLVLGAPEFQRR